MKFDLLGVLHDHSPGLTYKLVAALGATATALWWYLTRESCGDDTRPTTPTRVGLDYDTLRTLVQDEVLPAMLVDLDAFDHNVSTAASICRQSNKTLRLASKSVRVPELIQRCLHLHPEVFRGIMCFSIHEALFLAETIPEARDFLIAYPCVQKADIAAARELQRRFKATVSLMVDCVDHVRIVDRLWHSIDPSASLFVCVDVDAGYRLFNSRIHIGAHRSPCHTVEDLAEVVGAIECSQHLLFGGVMNYEAQIAGVPDLTSSKLMDLVFATIKYLSRRDIVRKREQIRDFLSMEGLGIPLFNGGGTGSLRDAVRDPVLTEVTMGSGFLQSSIFEHFTDQWRCAALFFGLRVTRSCKPGTLCCQSGGFIASGQIGPDKAPQIYLPPNLTCYPHEGFGEVQTPLRICGTNAHQLGIGHPVFLRPAKAGEIAEHFPEYLLVSRGGIVARARTYRGLGRAFY